MARTARRTAANGVIEEVTSKHRNYYNTEEVMNLMGCSKSKAQRVCKQVKTELVNKGILRDWYMPGQVPKDYFNEMIGIKGEYTR